MPHYSLEDVRIAAKNEQIEYRGRKVRRDISNLGYELKDVVTCLLSLTESDFYRSYTYENGDTDDAYRTDFINPMSETGETDSIYIKFCLINNLLMIDLASLHLSN